MTTPIDCDEVFYLLTRGPFPSGDPRDNAAELHLMTCVACRHFAEALRPAHDLFHEAVPSLELDSLPGYRGALCNSSRSVDCREAESPDDRFQSWDRQASWQQGGSNAVLSDYLVSRFVALMLIAIGVTGWLWLVGVLSPHGSVQAVAVGSESDASPQLLAENPLSPSRTLAALVLPAQCRDRSAFRVTATEQIIPVSRNSGNLQCCTHCHSESNRLLRSPSALSTVTNSCVACHRERK